MPSSGQSPRHLVVNTMMCTLDTLCILNAFQDVEPFWTNKHTLGTNKHTLINTHKHIDGWYPVSFPTISLGRKHATKSNIPSENSKIKIVCNMVQI